MSGFHATRDERSAAWFDALAQGRLLIRRCDRCGHLGAPDRFACSACLADDLDWVPASGAGTLLARIVDRTNGSDVVLGLIELAEGPWLLARITEPAEVGTSLVATALPPADGRGEFIPEFRAVT